MHSDDRDPVDVLAEEFADRLRRGEHPSVSVYAAAHPEHAEQLQELLPAVAQMELLKRFRAPATADKSLPDRLGDFRIVRELGRGGMGVVFEAVQESLGRPVALKVLARHAQLDQTHRERFVREAQAAAKLHHTNIVPVFGVGEQDGLPYYVMQLIPGAGLHALVRRWRGGSNKADNARLETEALTPGTRPTDTPPPFELAESKLIGPARGDWRFVAGIGLQAADALHYAHRHGVLHRDVKPANLILDGEIVWVADFGLAKLLNVEGLTATGDILGTLQYIPPECLSGHADARSDVYGLGATLYELLTLEPPYAADSPAKLIKKVTDTDPPAPRSLNSDIPRDLETIVLKAMAREPSNRYASAGELARDLEAFLDDRPIKARRTTFLSRAWRACRRNPAVASLAVSTAAALVLTAATGWVGYARTTAALGGEEARRKDAETATRAAEVAKADADRATTDARELSKRLEAKSKQLEANLKLSLETFEKVFEAAGGNGQPGFGVPMPPPPAGRGPGGPGADLASDKAAILEAVLAFYDKFVEQSAPSPQLRFEAAKASRRVCDANGWLKRPDKAVAAFRRAVALLEPLAGEFPDDDEMRTELFTAYLTAPPEAYPGDREAPLRRAAELARGSVWLTGSVQIRFGWVREQAGDHAAAERAYGDAIAAFTSPGAVKPAYGHLELGFARYHLAWVLSEQGKTPAARRALEKSVVELAPIVGQPDKPGDGPRHNPARELLAGTHWAMAVVCKKMNDDRAAVEATKNAFLVAGFPSGGPGGGGPVGGNPGKGPGGAFGGMWGKKDGFGGPKKN